MPCIPFVVVLALFGKNQIDLTGLECKCIKTVLAVKPSTSLIEIAVICAVLPATYLNIQTVTGVNCHDSMQRIASDDYVETAFSQSFMSGSKRAFTNYRSTEFMFPTDRLQKTGMSPNLRYELTDRIRGPFDSNWQDSNTRTQIIRIFA